MQQEIVVDMDVEEDEVEIVLDPEHILDSVPETRRPLIIRFPAPADTHLRTCIARFTGEHADTPSVRMSTPNRAPQNLRVPYYTLEIDQAMHYAQRLLGALVVCHPFDKTEWDPRVPRLQLIRTMAIMLPQHFQVPINGLIFGFSQHWHRSDLAMAFAIIFKQRLDTVMTRIDAVMAHVAANPPSAVTAEVVKKAQRGRPRKYVEGGEVILID